MKFVVKRIMSAMSVCGEMYNECKATASLESSLDLLRGQLLIPRVVDPRVHIYIYIYIYTQSENSSVWSKFQNPRGAEYEPRVDVRRTIDDKAIHEKIIL
jgi:hypothetical protein